MGTTSTGEGPLSVTILDSGSSSQSFFSLPGLSPFPSLDTLRELSSGRDTRSWRPPVKLSQLFKDTSTLPSDASLVLVPGFQDLLLVILLMNSSDSSITTLQRPILRL